MVENDFADEEGFGIHSIREYDEKLYHLLVGNSKDEAADIVQSIPVGAGLEAWRRLRERFDPTTPQGTMAGMVALNKWAPC